MPTDQGPHYGGKPASFWLNQLQDSNPKFRVEAVEALGSIAKKNKGLIPVLVSALSDKSDNVGGSAVSALGSLGLDAVPALLEVLKDKKSPKQVSRAAAAVGQVGPDAKAAVPVLTSALKMDDWAVRVSAIYSLGGIGPDAKTALPAMTDVYGDYLDRDPKQLFDNWHGRLGLDQHYVTFPQFIFVTMAKIDPLFTDSFNKECRVDLFDRYPKGSLSGGIPKDWRRFHDWLKKRCSTQKLTPLPDRQPKEGTAGDAAAKKELDKKDQGLLFRGKPASYWMGQFNDADPGFRIEAVEALGFFAKKNKEIVPLLAAYLKDEDYSVSRQASMTLGYLGPEVLPLLLELLKDKTSPATVTAAARAVYYMGPQAKAAVPLLAEALKINDWQVRRIVIIALHSIGPEAKPALPAMIDFLGDFIKQKGEAGDHWREAQELGSFFGQALLKIDPEIQKLVPGREINQLKATGWEEVYDALKKKYPTPNSTTSADRLQKGRESWGGRRQEGTRQEKTKGLFSRANRPASG